MKQFKLNNKGFSLVEIAVVVAIMIVLLAVLAPSLLKYTENSRMQKDDSAMDELCQSIRLAMADSQIFDEVCSYAILNNYITYTDSSGVYGAKYTDEEFWAPDGSGYAVTITWNPDENGDYTTANGLVNDMTYGNGSVADSRIADDLKQCYFSEMGDGKLYHKVEQTFGTTFSEKSATYNNSSYTVFIKLDVVDGIKRANVYGEWNGTNLTPTSPASLGSGTNSYDANDEPETTKTGGTTQSNFTSSDLQGGGGTSGNVPSYKKVPCGVEGHTWEDGKNHEMLACNHYGCQCSGHPIPEGGKYWVVNGPTLGPGDCFPEPQTGDEYRFGDFEYCYNGYASSGHSYLYWNKSSSINGWGAAPYSNKTAYGEILSHVGTLPVVSIENAFTRSDKMIRSPQIPETVTNMRSAYWGCDSLEVAPTLPPNNQTMHNVFSGCYNLKTYEGSTDPDGDFTNYKLVFNPEKGQCMEETFEACYLMTHAPIIPEGPKTLTTTFSGCKGLIHVPQLPESITSMGKTFSGCTSLQTITNIPQNITSLSETFADCTSLVSVPAIPTTKSISMSGTFKNCTSLQTAPIIPSNVYSVGQLFSGCTALTGNIQFDCNRGYYDYTYKEVFKNVDFERQQISLIGISTGLDTFGSSGSNYCTTCDGRHKNANESHICHGGDTATCIQKSICQICSNEYGDYGTHNAPGGFCTNCGLSATTIETAHNYPNSQNYVVVGTWNYSDAQSVNITIEYQTESTSYDWISLVSGNDYISGSSQNTRKQYLTTYGTFSNTTGLTSSIKFGGPTRTVKTFTNVNMLTGSVILRSNGGVTYWGAKVTIIPNY